MDSSRPSRPDSGLSDQRLLDQVEQAWETSWERFYDARTRLFYDWLSSLEPARHLAHLPTPEEIARQFPNRNGWGTGMEDCAISAGVMMSTVCDRFAATSDASLRGSAHSIFAGMVLLGTLSPSPGFVIRGVCPADRTSHYTESSIDQYTWYTFGLWRFFHSPLSDAAQQVAAQEIITTLCERLERNVTPQHDYHVGREDGTFDGMYDKFWQILAHEVARLPMIYAIGADLTGDPHWARLAAQYSPEAAVASLAGPSSTHIPYALLQEQVSLKPLYELAPDPESKRRWAAAMQAVAEAIAPVSRNCLDYAPPDLSPTRMDWRVWPLEPYGTAGDACPRWPEEYRVQDRTLREPAEAALAQLLCPGRPLPAEQVELLRRMVAQVDYGRVSSYGLFYLQAAYWRAVRQGVLTLP